MAVLKYTTERPFPVSKKQAMTGKYGKAVLHLEVEATMAYQGGSRLVAFLEHSDFAQKKGDKREEFTWYERIEGSWLVVHLYSNSYKFVKPSCFSFVEAYLRETRELEVRFTNWQIFAR